MTQAMPCPAVRWIADIKTGNKRHQARLIAAPANDAEPKLGLTDCGTWLYGCVPADDIHMARQRGECIRCRDAGHYITWGGQPIEFWEDRLGRRLNFGWFAGEWQKKHDASDGTWGVLLDAKESLDHWDYEARLARYVNGKAQWAAYLGNVEDEWECKAFQFAFYRAYMDTQAHSTSLAKDYAAMIWLIADQNQAAGRELMLKAGEEESKSLDQLGRQLRWQAAILFQFAASFEATADEAWKRGVERDAAMAAIYSSGLGGKTTNSLLRNVRMDVPWPIPRKTPAPALP